MKNLLKSALLILCFPLILVACDPPKAGSGNSLEDSSKSKTHTTKKTGDAVKKTGIDSSKKDTGKKM